MANANISTQQMPQTRHELKHKHDCHKRSMGGVRATLIVNAQVTISPLQQYPPERTHAPGLGPSSYHQSREQATLEAT